MSCLYLTEEDVSRLLTMPVAIAAVEKAFEALAEGKAHNIPRRRASGGSALLHSMSAAAEYLGYAGWKQYVTSRAGARFLFGMHELSNGKLVGLFEADRLGQQRTGAATGVALKHLTKCDFSSLALFGAGWQAQSQLEAVAAVLPHLSDVRVFARNTENCENFCKKMTSRLNLPIRAAASSAEAVRGAEVIVTVTSAKEPVFASEDADKVRFVAAMGSNWPQKVEIETAIIARAQQIVCDDVAACELEAGDLIKAANSGQFSWGFSENLWERIARPRPVEGLIVFKSVGLALEDLAVGAAILPMARQRGIGQELEIQMGP
jgi:ornithine cyclodeaminase/alanine dehydrogenase-like protein (mu-crystallin family)